MAKDIKHEQDFLNKCIQPSANKKIENLKYETLINLACNGHYPLFFPHWISEAINKVNRPISSREAKSQVEKMMNLIDKHNTLSKKRTALVSLSDDTRNIYIKSFIKLVELNILDSRDTGLH